MMLATLSQKSKYNLAKFMDYKGGINCPKCGKHVYMWDVSDENSLFCTCTYCWDNFIFEIPDEVEDNDD